jgi:hypothetical protein
MLRKSSGLTLSFDLHETVLRNGQKRICSLLLISVGEGGVLSLCEIRFERRKKTLRVPPFRRMN